MADMLKGLVEGWGKPAGNLDEERNDGIGEVNRWFNCFTDMIQTSETGEKSELQRGRKSGHQESHLHSTRADTG